VTRAFDTGRSGEAFVARRLEAAGYHIVDRNWRIRGGEIDLVALHGDVLVFVEVKVRSERQLVAAEESLDWRQLGRLMVAAERYIEQHVEFEDHVWRVDLVAVTISRSGVVRDYQHYENLTLE